MLELQNISYLVDDDNKEILRDINLEMCIRDRAVIVTDYLAGG